MKKILIFILLICFLTNCDFTYTYWSDGNYEVTNTAGAPDGYILYNSNHGRVSNILEIGSIGNFIVAKSENKYSNNKIEYWVLDKSKDDKYLNADEIMMGPYTIDEFI